MKNIKVPKYLVMDCNYPVAFIVYKKDYNMKGLAKDERENIEFIKIKEGEIQ